MNISVINYLPRCIYHLLYLNFLVDAVLFGNYLTLGTSPSKFVCADTTCLWDQWTILFGPSIFISQKSILVLASRMYDTKHQSAYLVNFRECFFRFIIYRGSRQLGGLRSVIDWRSHQGLRQSKLCYPLRILPLVKERTLVRRSY